MATTILPKPNPIDKSLTVQQIQDSVYNWFESAIGDRDHASDFDDHTWYDGESAGYENVLMLLEGIIDPFTPLPTIVHKAPKKVRSLFVPAVFITTLIVTRTRKD